MLKYIMQLYKSKRLKVKHAFSSRQGGVSQPPYDSLNLAYHVGDRRDDVVKNHKLFAYEAGFDFKKLVFMNQIHSNKVHVVDEDSFLVPSCDALVTNLCDTPLMVMSADCAPVLFYDEVSKTIAAAHVGRKGAFGNIVKNVLDVMGERFGAEAENIVVAVGPNIKSCCYEVGEKEKSEAKNLGYGFALSGTHLDIDAIIAHQLQKEGVLKEHVEFLPHCTCCESERFFSYRAQGETGRNAAVIVLEDYV